jgi:hypothetical protein
VRAEVVEQDSPGAASSHRWSVLAVLCISLLIVSSRRP